MKRIFIISSIIVIVGAAILAFIPVPEVHVAMPHARAAVPVETVTPAINDPDAHTPNPEAKKIFLALLLDTSNSMDGLIDQAKSQLWNVVDEMANAEHNDIPAELYISLYEYGNDNLSITSGYVRQVSPFTQDLDEISTQLFALRTNGGSEYCGTVIKDALENLTWDDSPNDLKMIFIAGNEEFDQGRISFVNSCKKAADNNTIVNTIFCGAYNEGIRTYWKKGAELGGGSYLNIDMDQKTVYVSTPYDAQIDSLNDALNNTYVGYGRQGAMRKEKQLTEDLNAASYSRSNKVKRAISKSKHVYKNESWDLVDAVKNDKVRIKDVKPEDLPEEMKGLSMEEKKLYLEKKTKQRKYIQKQIGELAVKRKSYVMKVKQEKNEKNELESAIVESVKTKAIEKSFTFKEN